MATVTNAEVVAHGLLSCVVKSGASRHVVASVVMALLGKLVSDRDCDLDIQERLGAVQEAMEVQKANKVSHLQKLEISTSNPRVGGLSRSQVKRLRKKRNSALHQGFEDVDASVSPAEQDAGDDFMTTTSHSGRSADRVNGQGRVGDLDPSTDHQNGSSPQRPLNDPARQSPPLIRPGGALEVDKRSSSMETDITQNDTDRRQGSSPQRPLND